MPVVNIDPHISCYPSRNLLVIVFNNGDNILFRDHINMTNSLVIRNDVDNTSI